MYALLGSGRLARHFGFYLQTLGLPVQFWSRKADPEQTQLAKTLESSSHILLALNDSALPQWVEQLHADYPLKVIVHFSGALVIPHAAGAHPLMTFGDRLGSLEWYQNIPFLIDKGFSFGDILPGLNNPHFSIDPQDKSLYHALCSLAGNSTYLLWNKIGDQFEQKLNLPRSILSPFLHQVVANASSKGEKNFTGPVARGDWSTVQTHLSALKNHPDLHHAYEAYLHLCQDAGIALPRELL